MLPVFLDMIDFREFWIHHRPEMYSSIHYFNFLPTVVDIFYN